MSLDKGINTTSSISAVSIQNLKETTASGRRDVGVTSQFIGNFDIQFPSVADKVSIVSDDAQDNSVGTGIQTVSIVGIDNNLKFIEEIVTLNGTTPVLTNADFLRVNYIASRTVGSNDSAVGNITATIGGNASGVISVGQNETNSTYHVIPIDRREQFSIANFNSFSTKIITIKILYRPVGQSFFWELIPFTFRDFNIVFPINALLSSGIEVAVFAFTDTGSADISCALTFNKLN